ncbi:MAG: Gfo/Idh/MocA family oxidoreductase [Gemmataceae bacterium]|nr:Gfo/Idh/MocA family oxidoreductase [Gemmataceae bacterium]
MKSQSKSPGEPLRLGVVGVGHLGKEHARIASGLAGVKLVGVADPNRAQAETVAGKCNCQAFDNHLELMDQVDAVVVVTPTRFHHAVAMESLARGLPTLVEKPITPTAREARELEQAAEKAGVALQVGHIERFNPAYEAARQTSLVPRYIRAERAGKFTGRSLDVGAVLDLMIHDLDLVLDWDPSEVVSVEAFGAAVLGGHEDIAQARLRFRSGLIADISACRVSPVPARRMTALGSEGVVEIDFANKKIDLIQPSHALAGGLLDATRMTPLALQALQQEMTGHLEQTGWTCEAQHDQLTRELMDFTQAARSGKSPRVTGTAGRRVVELAERIIEAMAGHCWTGRVDGPQGVRGLPAPRGPLVASARRAAA